MIGTGDMIYKNANSYTTIQISYACGAIKSINNRPPFKRLKYSISYNAKSCRYSYAAKLPPAFLSRLSYLPSSTTMATSTHMSSTLPPLQYSKG